MARYIDIDDFRKNAYYADTDLDIGVYLAEHGCADVAPRAEVAKIFADIEKFRDRTPFGYICFSVDEFEEIKKKHTQ